MDEKRMKQLVTAYTVQACSAVKICFISPRFTINQYFEEEYSPAMAHQVFGIK